MVADTSGAYIPGHGTPTVIIVGRNQQPVGPTVRAVLGVRGEPGQPDDPARGTVWTSITGHVDDSGWDDNWITVADLDRQRLATHPWSLSGGGAVALLEALSMAASHRLGAVAAEIGIMAVIGEDDAFEIRRGSSESTIPMVLGEGIRDFVLEWTPRFWPYDSEYRVTDIARASKSMWPFRRLVSGYLMFGKTRAQRGMEWLEYGMLAKAKLRAPLSIAFAFVATHNHFALDRGGKIFNRSAPVIKLPEGTSEAEHLALLGVLNSSTACFWLKQKSQAKTGADNTSGGGNRWSPEPWYSFYEFTGTTLEHYPLTSVLPLQHGRYLDELAHELAAQEPSATYVGVVPSADSLEAARKASDDIRARMVAVQEELDWEVYRLYGLLEENVTYSGVDLPVLAPGQRAFEISLARAVQAGQQTTAWFTHHGYTPIVEIPMHWPTSYRDLVQRRLDLIASDPSIRLLERPEYKRRWSQEPWEKRQERTLRDWLLDRLEDRRFWFDAQRRPLPRSVAQLADDVSRNADLVSVLALWEGRPDVPVTQSLVRLLADEAVPYLAAYRYKDSGLRKRQVWEETWALQRREDAEEKVGPIAVPPKYISADFRKNSYWQARGKLDVPKERFILYPDAGRETDPTPLLGWAGSDHAQQSLALSLIIGEREKDGWADDRLVPLVAGLAELQPWVEQWHGEVDPNYGVSLAAFCREQLIARAAQVGKTLDALAAWRPAPAARARVSARKGTS